LKILEVIQKGKDLDCCISQVVNILLSTIFCGFWCIVVSLTTLLWPWNRKFVSWNWVRNNLVKKFMQAVQEHCQKPSGLVL